MKRIFSIFMIFFLMSSTSFAFKGISCNLWAFGAATAEEDTLHGGNMDLKEFNEAMNYYQSICNEAGGSENIGDPVFLQ